MKESKTMTPEQILKALDDVEISQAGLARDLNASRSLIHQIIYNKAKSHRVRCHIALAINKPVNEIWEIKENPTQTGRPLTKGYYDHHQRAVA